ncbi:Cation/H+ exchanger [Cyathus striatus]|nr:Cation/H+ exchanger [Cyathus striatus]
MNIQYDIPELPTLLAVAGFLYFINVFEAIFGRLINARLIGSLFIGVIFGPQATNIVPRNILESFVLLGYIGLLLLVFEAGLTTNIKLLFRNLALSATAASVGIGVPISLSLLLLHVGFGYTALQAFGAGASLCSTSLGTTLALLRPELRQTRVGAVLLSAALLDDIAGLVIAGIISNLATDEDGKSNNVPWQLIARPILVSVAFAVGVPLIAHVFRLFLVKLPSGTKRMLYTSKTQLFFIIATLSGMVSGAKYAGTSELFGAYLAGALLSYIFPPCTDSYSDLDNVSCQIPVEAFSTYLSHLLEHFFSPLFFSSIGAALPIRSLISVNGSHRVVWRGIVYSLLMVAAKAMVGITIFVWPDSEYKTGWFGRRITESPLSTHPCMSRHRAVCLLGLAMVARGEIALIVAQLAKPLLVTDTTSDNSEPFAIVIWAVLVSTVGGAVAVGLLVN